MEITQEQIQKLKESGLSDEKISALASQSGYTLPAPKQITPIQFATLKSKGLSDEKISTLAQSQGFSLPEQPGFVQSLAQGIAKPFLKVASSVRSIPGILGADTKTGATESMTKPYDYGYLGQVTPLNVNNPLEAIGVGAEIGSYALGGSGAAKSVATGLTGKVVRGALQGAKAGAVSGGTMSFGQALQEADVTPSDVAYKTLFGTATGGALGGGLGAIAPIMVKTGNVARRFTNLEQINTELKNLNTQVFKPTPTQLEKWSTKGKDPMQTFTEIFGTDIPPVGKDNRFTQEGIRDAVARVNDVYKPAAEGFNTILRNSPEVNSLSKAEADAIKNLDIYGLTPQMEEKAIANIRSNFQAIKTKAARDGVLLGEDSVPVAYSDILKDKFWNATRNFGTEDATVANSVNSSIGHGFKDAIENSITDLNVQNYNKRLGDLITLRDFLETKAGALSGTGGKMTRIGARIAGTVVGSSNGPIGSIIGNITGDTLAQIMINPAMQPYRWLINKQLQKLPPAKILQLEQEANDVIQKMYARRQEAILQYALPEGSPVGSVNNPFIMGAENTASGVQSGVKLQPAQKGLPVADPVTGKMKTVYISGERTQPLSKSAIQEPTINPTANVSNNPIEESISQKLVGSEINKRAAGGVAGIEIKQDENGKTKITFNPEKAMIGIVGMTAYSKIPQAIKKEAKIKITDELTDLVSKELSKLDTLPVNTNAGLAFGNTDKMFILDQLKTKLEKGALSKADTLRAIPLLKEQGVDVMKNAVEKITKYKQNPVTGKLEGSIKSDTLLQEAKKYKSAENSLKKELPSGNIVNTRGFLLSDGSIVDMGNFGQHIIELRKAGWKGSVDDFANSGGIRLRNTGVNGQQNIQINKIPTKEQIDSLKNLSSDIPVVYDITLNGKTTSSPSDGVTKNKFISQLTDLWNKANPKK